MTAPTIEEHALAALSPTMLIRQALTAGVAPFVVYEIARHAGLADVTALAWSAAPPAIAVAVEWLWRRQVNVIGAIVLTGILAGLTAVTLLHGDELLLKMRESVVTGLFGVLCLSSLVLPMRPALFYIGRALASAGDKGRRADFGALWDDAQARRVFTTLTLTWGVGLVVEAGLRAILALELPTGRFLVLTPVVGWVVVGSLLFWTMRYIRTARHNADADADAGELAPEAAGL